MADRPYVSHLTRDLERVFESNLNDKKVLNELKKELSFRSRPKAMKLKERVESRLTELKQGRHAIEQANLLEVSGVKLERSQRALFEVAACDEEQEENLLPAHAEEKQLPCRQLSFFDKIAQQLKKYLRG